MRGTSPFHGGDFREQAGRAAAVGGGVAAFPPTYNNDYERLYRFVDQNTEWPRPSYNIWDPASVEDRIDTLIDMKVRYCVLVEHKLQRHEPLTAFFGSLKPVYTYADSGVSLIRRLPRTAQPFGYTALDADTLMSKSQVEIINATGGQMNFLKDIYLAKEIQHTTGTTNFLVMIDGHLAGDAAVFTGWLDKIAKSTADVPARRAL